MFLFYKQRHLEEIHYNYLLVIMFLSQNDLNITP